MRGKLPAMRVSVAAAIGQFDYAVAHVHVDSPRRPFASEDPRVVVPFGADNRCGRVRRRDAVDVTARRPAGRSTVAGQRRVAVLRRRPRKHALLAARAGRRATNFKNLEVAWRFKTDSLGPRPEFKLEGTPLMVKGVLYTTAGTRRSVVALDAATGELMWVHGEREGARSAAAPRQLSGRGVAYWTDGRDERILYVTIGFRLVELDAKTGALVTAFGKNGIVDLKEAARVRQSAADRSGRPAKSASTPRRPSRATASCSSARRCAKAARRRRTTTRRGSCRRSTCGPARRLWNFNTIPRPGRVRQRHLAERLVGRQRQRRRLEPDLGRRRTGPGVPAGRDAHLRFLRRPSSRQQPVCRQHRRGRSEDRPAQVALPAGASLAVELRRVGGADPRRHHRERPSDQGGAS